MPPLLRGAGDRAPAPIRGLAGLLPGGTAVSRGGAPLRLLARRLPRAVPRLSPRVSCRSSSQPDTPGRREQPKKSRAHEQIVALRKRNYSVYEISQALKEQGTPLSATAVREVLAAEGFAPLPRRLDEERPDARRPQCRSRRQCPRLRARPRASSPPGSGGLFLFVPDLVRLDGDALAHGAKLPGLAHDPGRPRACAPRWRSSCGRSNARATSWRWSPTRGSRCSAGSMPCPRRASCRNIPRASPRSKVSRLLGLLARAGDRRGALHRRSRSISTSTPCPTSASIRSSNPTICPCAAAASPAS